MEPIYPLTDEHLDRFRGQLVCVVMKDGTRHVGILSRCRGGRLVLNEEASAAEEGDGRQAKASAKRRSRRRAGSRKRGNGGAPDEAVFAAGFGDGWADGPEVGPFGGGFRPPYGPPHGFFGPRLLLDLALIALVLLIL